MAPASYSRAPAAFLSIHSAYVSGVALSVPELDGRGRVTDYEVLSFSEIKSQQSREDCVGDALEEAENLGVPLVIIGEMPRRTVPELIEHCETWGMWLAAFELADSTLIVRAYRSTVEGLRRPTQHIHTALGIPDLSENIAKALCLRLWAQQSSEVRALLKPKPKAKKKRKAA